MELLAKRQARVTEVARACGFESLSAFTTAFVEVVRERPKDFRRRVQSRSVPAG
jgi:AraC-like DNA-binding protein